MTQHKDDLKFYQDKLRALKAEYEPLAKRADFLKAQIDAFDTLIKTLKDAPQVSPNLFSNSSRVNRTELKKYEDEKWEDYVIRIIKHLKNSKSGTMKMTIKQYNPNLQMSYINKAVDKYIANLKMDGKLKVTPAGKGKGHGNYYAYVDSK